MRTLVLALLIGCGAAESPPPAPEDAEDAPAPIAATFLLTGAIDLDGAPIEVAVRDGEIAPRAALPADAPRLDARGAIVIPAWIDAHVHLSYLDVADRHAAGGVAVAIDLGAPIEALAIRDQALLVLRAGPMITRPRGYPLGAWGHDGYGIECADPASCEARVQELVARGAALIKVPVSDDGLDDASLAAIVRAAHAGDRQVVAHALRDRDARRAADAGVDVLAHTPVEALADATIEAWRGRAVISTLAAFGGTDDTVANLARLRAAGVAVIYGTDLGNRRTPGIDARELSLLASAGLDGRAIVESATSTPARVFGLARHGSLAPGHAASFLLVRATDPASLARPELVVIDGRPRS